ncbi:hypothetical protein ABW10_13340, partial [Pluralibacter gergoviae]
DFYANTMIARLSAVFTFKGRFTCFQFRIEKVRKSHVEVNHRLLQRNRIIFFKPSIPAGFLRHSKQWFEVFTRV